MAKQLKVSILLEAIADTKGFQAFSSGLGKAETAAARLGQSLKTVKGIASGVGIAGGLAAGAITTAGAAAIKYASDIQDMASQTGVSTRALQVLGHTAAMNGSSLDEMSKALVQAGKNAAEAAAGSAEAEAKFARLGLSAAAFAKLRPEQQMERLGRAIYNATDQQEALAAAMDLVGAKNAPKLMESLRTLGRDGYAALAADAERAGQVMSSESIKALDDAGDRIQAFTTKLTILAGEYLRLASIAFTGGDALAEAAEKLSDAEADGGLDSVKRIADARMDYIDVLVAQGEAERALVEAKRLPKGFEKSGETVMLDGGVALTGSGPDTEYATRRAAAFAAIAEAARKKEEAEAARAAQAKIDAAEAAAVKESAAAQAAAKARDKEAKEAAKRAAAATKSANDERADAIKTAQAEEEAALKEHAAKIDAVNNRAGNEYARRGLQLGEAQDIGSREPAALGFVAPTAAMLAPKFGGREDVVTPRILNSIDATLKIIARKDIALA